MENDFVLVKSVRTETVNTVTGDNTQLSQRTDIGAAGFVTSGPTDKWGTAGSVASGHNNGCIGE